MADTFTEFLNLTKPEIGGSRDSWGDKGNGNADKIDTWAKATDKLAKDALSRVSAAAQSVAGPVTFAALASFSEGGSVSAGKNFAFGSGYIRGESGRTLLAAAADNFEVVNQANSQYILQANLAGVFKFRGADVYTTSNIDMGKFFDRTNTARQELSGPFSVNMAAPYFDLTYGGVMRMRQIVDGNGAWILRNGDNADNFAYITTGGSMWLKSFGDVNTRIENRAAVYADDRLASAKAYTDSKAGNYVPMGGATVPGNYYHTGSVGVRNADLYVDGIGGSAPQLRLYKDDVGNRTLILLNSGELVFTKTDGGGSHYFRQDGSAWFNQIGDLNNRIESRAQAFADDRLNAAKAYTDANINTFRANANTFTQDQRITKTYPSWQLLYPGVRDYSVQVRENGAFHIWDNTAGRMALYVGPGGDLATAQFGDVNSRIENRAAAYANDAFNNANANTANNYVPRNNGNNRLEISTYLSASGAWPFWELVWGGKVRWQIRIADNNELQFMLPDTGTVTHAFRTDGSAYFSQIGDVNSRIESRAVAWTNSRNLRLAYAGDVGTDWKNGDGAFNEPFFGGCCTGVRQANNQITGHRWRYLQLQGTDGNWYTVSFA